MNRTLWLCLGALMVAFTGVYRMKYEARDVRGDVARLEEELDAEYEALHVLEAEWAYLNRPQRLQELADRHLRLAPQSGEQLAEESALRALPRRGAEGEIIPAMAR